MHNTYAHVNTCTHVYTHIHMPVLWGEGRAKAQSESGVGHPCVPVQLRVSSPAAVCRAG